MDSMGFAPLTRVVARCNEVHAWKRSGREVCGEEGKGLIWTTVEGVGVGGYEAVGGACGQCAGEEGGCWCRVWKAVGK